MKTSTMNNVGTMSGLARRQAQDWKELVKEALPPKILDKIRSFKNSRIEPPGQKPPEWYDKSFEEGDTYHKHYTESVHYAIWTVLIDRIRKHGPAEILEIGCGTGQLAWALQDYALLVSYCGLDFSPKRIAHACEQCPDLDFHVADAFETDLFVTQPYDLVVTTEFLEHVEQDLDVIAKVRSGTHFIATVPNYPWTSHVRHFETCKEVTERYSSLIENLDVFPLIRLASNKIIYVMEGQKI